MSEQRNFIGAVCFVAALSVPGLAMAAGFANTAHSATSTGMAGVATGNVDEPNSTFYNPASMVFREGFNVYVGDTVIIPSVSYESLDGAQTAETLSEIFPPPNFNLALAFGKGFAVGVGGAFTWGLGIAWPDDWLGRENFRSQSLETFNLTPTVAYKVPGLDLSFAAGAQLLASSLRQEWAIILREDTEVDVILGGRGFGAGGIFAAMYRVNDDISVGLNYRSAAKISYEGRAHFSENVEQTPFAGRMVDQDISTSITVPHTVNLGLGWQVLDPLWVGVDLNYMTWSVYDQVEVRFSEQSPEAEPGSAEPPLVVEANWRDAMAFRVGGQYEVIDNLNARLGFALDLTPVPDSTVGPSLPDNNRYVFAAGLGYSIKGFRADLGYQFIYLNPRVVENGSVDGTYQLGSHLMGLNLGYGF